MEAATRAELFPFVSLGCDVSTLDLTTLWRQIEGLQSPGPAPNIQATRPSPSAEAAAVANSFRRANILAFAMALAIGGIGVFGGLSAPAPLLFLIAALMERIIRHPVFGIILLFRCGTFFAPKCRC